MGFPSPALGGGFSFLDEENSAQAGRLCCWFFPFPRKWFFGFARRCRWFSPSSLGVGCWIVSGLHLISLSF